MNYIIDVYLFSIFLQKKAIHLPLVEAEDFLLSFVKFFIVIFYQIKGSISRIKKSQLN